MAIDHDKEIFVFDQVQNAWFEWSYSDSKFCILESCPKITSLNFAGIGIRKINLNGINAIEDLYINSFNKAQL